MLKEDGSYLPLSEHKITTMTMVSIFEGFVYDMETLFHMLYVSDIPEDIMPEIKPPIVGEDGSLSYRKMKAPCLDMERSIVTAKWERFIRGFNNRSNKNFKNCVGVSICVNSKNISVKICPEKFHITGAPSLESGRKTVEYLVEMIENIRCILRYIKENRSICNIIIDYFLSKSRGSKEPVLGFDKHLGEERIFTPLKRDFDPPLSDKFFSEFLFSLMDDKVCWESYSESLLHIRSLENFDIFSGNINNIEHNVCMTNYVFNIGFCISRPKMKTSLKGFDGFDTAFNSILDDRIFVRLPYSRDLHSRIKKKSGINPRITFMVARTGAVTLSGPGGQVTEDAYVRFMESVYIKRKEFEFEPENK